MPASEPLSSHQTVVGAYSRAVESGGVQHDSEQLALAKRLDRLLDDIMSSRRASKSSALGWLFAKRAPKRDAIRGLYIYGRVGRGKTMLMDMFHNLLPVKRKRRAHFNDFMADIHDRIAAKRQEFKRTKTGNADPIAPVASDIAAQSRVLCFDEFSVTDIADAMILSRLFSALFDKGVILVATSNVAPSALYHDGLNRNLFEPFIALLARFCETVNLDARTDYRLEKLSRLPVYISPLGPQAEEQFEMAWFTATEGASSRPDSVELKGRRIEIPAAAAGFARFTFEELCTRPLGARDYLALAGKYHGFFVENIPEMDYSRRNEAKRLILFIDIVYNAGARLVVSAAAEPDRLYAARTGTETFEFARTASRLIEMQSIDWPNTGHAPSPGKMTSGKRNY